MEIRYTIDKEFKDYITEEDIETILTEVKDSPRNTKMKRVRLTISVEDGYIGYKYNPTPIQRIRRITGYLVGDTNRWNSAKKQELDERVKHSFKNKV